jgi:hypothetical protein
VLHTTCIRSAANADFIDRQTGFHSFRQLLETFGTSRVVWRHDSPFDIWLSWGICNKAFYLKRRQIGVDSSETLSKSGQFVRNIVQIGADSPETLSKLGHFVRNIVQIGADSPETLSKSGPVRRKHCTNWGRLVRNTGQIRADS